MHQLPRNCAISAGRWLLDLAWQPALFDIILIGMDTMQFATGLYVDADEIDAWIDSIGTSNEQPPPTRHF